MIRIEGRDRFFPFCIGTLKRNEWGSFLLRRGVGMDAKRLTEGALLLAVFTVLLLITLYVPILSIIVNLFLALPFIFFSAKNKWSHSIVFLFASLFISMIFGTVLAIPLALSYGLTGVVIGYLIREGKSRIAAFIGGTITFLVTLVLEYVAAIILFEMNFIKEAIVLFEESLDQSLQMLEALGQTPNEMVIEQFEASLQLLETLMPSLFVLASLFIVFFIQLVSLPIVSRFGIKVPKWPPLKDMKLPKSLIWYYLAVLVASLFINVEQQDYWYSAILNLSFILQNCMLLQGVFFIFFFSHEKKISKAVPIITTVLMFFIPILLYIVRILGIIDLGFDLRKRLEKK